jgi:hypothetical protein
MSGERFNREDGIKRFFEEMGVPIIDRRTGLPLGDDDEKWVPPDDWDVWNALDDLETKGVTRVGPTELMTMSGLLEEQGRELERQADVIAQYDVATDSLMDYLAEIFDVVIDRLEAGDVTGCLAYCQERRTKLHGGLDQAVADEIIRQIRQEDDGEIRERPGRSGRRRPL